MSYYTFTPLEPFELARVAEVNSRFEQAAAAFDTLPPAAYIAQQRMTYAVAGGTGNALTAAMPVTVTSYNAGLLVTVKLIADNTGPATINVDGLGAVQIVRPDNAALEDSDLLAGAVVDLRYDGTAFRLMGGINPSAVNASTLVAQAAATAADASADAAAASASTASGAQAAVATNATNASNSASAAATSATAAASSATAAASSASSASTSASTATTKASDASTSAATATTQASAAATSATAAASSATSAASSATTATTKAGEASDSAAAAAQSAIDAQDAAGTLDGSSYMAKSQNLNDVSNKGTARTNLGVAIGSDVQAYNAKLAALSGLTGAANKLAYFTGASTMGVTDLTATGITLIGAANAAAVRTAIGTVIGTDVQAYDAELAALAGLTSAANKLPYFSGSGSASLATFTAFARTLVDDANAAEAQATLGLVIGTNVQAFDSRLANLAALTLSGNGGKAIRVNSGGTEFELVTPTTAPTVIKQASDQSFTTAVATAVTSSNGDFTTGTLVNGGVYRVTVRGQWNSTSTSTGLGLSVGASASHVVTGIASTSNSATAVTDTPVAGSVSALVVGNAAATATAYQFTIQLIVTAGTTSAVTIQAYNTAATGTVKVLTGSTMTVERLS